MTEEFNYEAEKKAEEERYLATLAANSQQDSHKKEKGVKNTTFIQFWLWLLLGLVVASLPFIIANI